MSAAFYDSLTLKTVSNGVIVVDMPKVNESKRHISSCDALTSGGAFEVFKADVAIG